MASDPNSPKSLVIVTSDFEANAIVQELAAQGIMAQAVGGYTSEFRAEAPGSVTVLVKGADLEVAKLVMAELEQNLDQLDWSSIDVGLPEDV